MWLEVLFIDVIFEWGYKWFYCWFDKWNGIFYLLLYVSKYVNVLLKYVNNYYVLVLSCCLVSFLII